MRRRMLIAGVGNIFFGDDGFGVEVARRLAAEPVPEWVRVADFGIRGLHLAYELADGGYETTVLVDATPRGGTAGTVYLIEPDLASAGASDPAPDPHGMSVETVFSAMASLGGTPGRVLIVGCEPVETGEKMGLSAPVARAVDRAVELVRELIEREGSRVTLAKGA
jgi:hydrogenase maturation protease